MPSTVPKIRRSRRIGFKWNTEVKTRILQKIRDNPAYRYAFFDTSPCTVTPKSVAGRELCFEMLQHDTGWVEAMKERGLIIERDGDLFTTDKWERYSDPFTRFMFKLDDIFDPVSLKKEFGIDINEAWAEWSDVPKRHRAEFETKFPYYLEWHKMKYSPAPYHALPPISDHAQTGLSAKTRRRKQFKRTRSPTSDALQRKRRRAEHEGEDNKNNINSLVNPIIIDSSSPSASTRSRSSSSSSSRRSWSPSSSTLSSFSPPRRFSKAIAGSRSNTAVSRGQQTETQGPSFSPLISPSRHPYSPSRLLASLSTPNKTLATSMDPYTTSKAKGKGRGAILQTVAVDDETDDDDSSMAISIREDESSHWSGSGVTGLSVTDVREERFTSDRSGRHNRADEDIESEDSDEDMTSSSSETVADSFDAPISAVNNRGSATTSLAVQNPPSRSQDASGQPGTAKKQSVAGTTESALDSAVGQQSSYTAEYIFGYIAIHEDEDARLVSSLPPEAKDVGSVLRFVRPGLHDDELLRLCSSDSPFHGEILAFRLFVLSTALLKDDRFGERELSAMPDFCVSFGQEDLGEWTVLHRNIFRLIYQHGGSYVVGSSGFKGSPTLSHRFHLYERHTIRGQDLSGVIPHKTLFISYSRFLEFISIFHRGLYVDRLREEHLRVARQGNGGDIGCASAADWFSYVYALPQSSSRRQALTSMCVHLLVQEYLSILQSQGTQTLEGLTAVFDKPMICRVISSELLERGLEVLRRAGLRTLDNISTSETHGGILHIHVTSASKRQANDFHETAKQLSEPSIPVRMSLLKLFRYLDWKYNHPQHPTPSQDKGSGYQDDSMSDAFVSSVEHEEGTAQDTVTTDSHVIDRTPMNDRHDLLRVARCGGSVDVLKEIRAYLSTQELSLKISHHLCRLWILLVHYDERRRSKTLKPIFQGTNIFLAPALNDKRIIDRIIHRPIIASGAKLFQDAEVFLDRTTHGLAIELIGPYKPQLPRWNPNGDGSGKYLTLNYLHFMQMVDSRDSGWSQQLADEEKVRTFRSVARKRTPGHAMGCVEDRELFALAQAWKSSATIGERLRDIAVRLYIDALALVAPSWLQKTLRGVHVVLTLEYPSWFGTAGQRKLNSILTNAKCVIQPNVSSLTMVKASRRINITHFSAKEIRNITLLGHASPEIRRASLLELLRHLDSLYSSQLGHAQGKALTSGTR